LSQNLNNLLLHEAITEGDLEACQRAIDAGADPSASLHDGDRVPLIRTIERGFTEGALLLIERGAALSSAGVGAPAPLQAAARENNLEVCKALLARDASVDECGGDGNTALLAAASKLNVEICRLLLDHGANPDAPGHSIITPIRLVVVSSGAAAIEVLDMLVKAGAYTGPPPDDEDALVSNKLTAFQYAVANGSIRQVAYLLSEADEDPEQTTKDGRTMFELSTRGAVDQLLHAAITERRLAAALCDVGSSDASDAQNDRRVRTVGLSAGFGSL
jgi:ankyrin repeat protein